MLDCPNCGDSLIPIAAQSTDHLDLNIDHCLTCGGNWFDRYEINKIQLADVYKIAQATDIKRKEPPWGKMERLCPRDFMSLVPYKTEVTPENIRLERCLTCSGIFIMQKDLEKFKLAQISKMNTYAKSSLPFISLKSVFIPVLFVGLLLFSTFLTVTNLKEAQLNQSQAKVLIASLKTIPIDAQHEAILFITHTPQIVDLEYGTNLLNLKTVSVSSTPSTSHELILQDLSPNTEYKYRIIIRLENGEKIVSEEFRFTTSK